MLLGHGSLWCAHTYASWLAPSCGLPPALVCVEEIDLECRNREEFMARPALFSTRGE